MCVCSGRKKRHIKRAEDIGEDFDLRVGLGTADTQCNWQLQSPTHIHYDDGNIGDIAGPYVQLLRRTTNLRMK